MSDKAWLVGELLSLGFDVSLCEQAAEQTSTLAEASEWILDTLEVGQQAESAVAAEPTNTNIETTQVMDCLPLKSIHPSRSEEDYIRETQARATKVAKDNAAQRRMEREARRRTLQAIEEDKARRRELGKAKLTCIDPCPNGTEAQPPAPTPQANHLSRPTSNEATLQIRLPDGRVLRETFLASTTLQTVFELVLREVGSMSIVDLALRMPTGAKAYTCNDAARTLLEAGMAPSAAMMVIDQRKQKPMSGVSSYRDYRRAEPPIHSRSAGNGPNIHGLAYRNGGGNLRSQQFGVPQRSVFSGSGHSLKAETPVRDADGDVETHYESAQVPSTSPQTDLASRRQAALQKWNERLFEKSNSESAASRQSVHKPSQPPKSLKDITSDLITPYIGSVKPGTADILKSLNRLSSTVAESLLGKLKEQGTLNERAFGRLGACFLDNVILDAYDRTTDTLIEAITVTPSVHSITKFSARSCDVLTNVGIRQLEYLRALEWIDLASCNISDTGLCAFAGLTSLRHLDVSKSKIKFVGLSTFLNTTKSKDCLEWISVQGCPGVGSKDLIHVFEVLPNLVHLDVSFTTSNEDQAIHSPASFKKLESLNLAGTNFGEDTMKQVVCRLGNLKSLNLLGMTQVDPLKLGAIGRALPHLTNIRFPSRDQPLEYVLSSFTRSLSHLDLNAFRNVTELAMEHIGQMLQLKVLNLSNTHVTDEGLANLKDLAKLEEIYLDRCRVGDIGCRTFLTFTHLHTLSLAYTSITDATLEAMSDTSTSVFNPTLRILNCAGCAVTDRGVYALRTMENLVNLNLDNTQVSRACPMYLAHLNSLQPLRLKGITKLAPDEGELQQEHVPGHLFSDAMQIGP
ncbi:hypothetical protein BZG36_00254 [Bifiguratus adelaidae]|uniref:UBX domain-containing protein n=1 Tax=Bifiguratus adelaidae TaxID=1938954 RepID=A0A261Y8E9_9FUNG|nr:hypothetical protein BZG36_00254 [Bifiguratus adelaidae]